MKVQLQGQSLRLRIDEEELARLLAGEDVVNRTQAAPGAIASQRLRLLVGADSAAAPGDEGRAAARFDADGGTWAFSLPEAEVRDYVGRLPCRDALEFELPGGEAALKLAFEVDVRDSVRRRGPPRRRAAPRPD
ncbi:hypothetical protein WCE41_03110 [Luteimonas sp. MJ246]|uniref:hypothetical protein n=1 Tax=Luteimonas sp. MJ174 TaxID=3129237 RepID=UPI0031BAF060